MLWLEIRPHTIDGTLYLFPDFVHMSLHLLPGALVGALQLVEVLPSLRLCGAQRFEMFLILDLGVRLDLLGTGFESFGLRFPLVQLLFDQRLIIFPKSHDISPIIGITLFSAI